MRLVCRARMSVFSLQARRCDQTSILSRLVRGPVQGPPLATVEGTVSFPPRLRPPAKRYRVGSELEYLYLIDLASSRPPISHLEPQRRVGQRGKLRG